MQHSCVRLFINDAEGGGNIPKYIMPHGANTNKCNPPAGHTQGQSNKTKNKNAVVFVTDTAKTTHTQKHTSMQNLHTGSFYKTAGISVPLHPPFHKEDEHNKQYETAGMFHIVYHMVPVN